MAVHAEHGNLVTRHRLHAAVGVLLACLAAACAVPRQAAQPTPENLTFYVEHGERNRCAYATDQACRGDADCPGDRCVAVLVSDAGARGRDGGHTLRLGERVLWQFGDSFVGESMLSATAAWSDAYDPGSLRDAVDDDGTPSQFLPYTAAELAFNAAHAAPDPCCRDPRACPADAPYCHCPAHTDCTLRLALWPGDGAALDDRRAYVLYDRQLTGTAPYDFRDAGVGIAEVELDAATARRHVDANGEAHLVFPPGEPHFTRGLRVDSDDGAYFHAFASTDRHACSVDILAARVPVEHLHDRARYTFWNGSSWTSEVARAVPILDDIAGGLGSVAWSPTLGRFVAAWNDLCTPGDTLLVRTAPAPQGPWSAPQRIDLAAFGARPDAYYATLHPAFGDTNGLWLSYFQPVDAVDGQIRLLKLRWRHR